jgi:hypothetical protein
VRGAYHYSRYLVADLEQAYAKLPAGAVKCGYFIPGMQAQHVLYLPGLLRSECHGIISYGLW